MPEIETFADIDPDDYFQACSTRERKMLIDIVVEESKTSSALSSQLLESVNNHFPEISSDLRSAIEGEGEYYTSITRDEFITSLVKLGEAYYRLSNDDIEKINELAKRF